MKEGYFMKKLTALILTLIMAIGILPMGVTASENIYVTVDGATLNFDQPPIMQNDRVLVPMRLIFEALGATVEWDEYNQYVKATKDQIDITMQIGNSTMVKNGEYITLDTAPILLNGRTLVPVRAVAESLDATVEWRGEINTVVIEKKVIPKRYATETVVYAPDAESIITDKDNNIYYIQDNKVMVYKNGLASVYADIEPTYDDVDISNISDTEDRFHVYGIYSIIYNKQQDAILAALVGHTGGANWATGLIVDITNNKLLSYLPIFSSSFALLDELVLEGNILYGRSLREYLKINLTTGQSSEIESPIISDDNYTVVGGYYPYITSVINSKLTVIVFNRYSMYYCQYNPSKNNYDTTLLQKFDKTFEDSFIGTDGTNFYYTQDNSIYQVTPTKQVNLWLSYEEIDFQDQTAITGEGRFSFDNDGNILFYDETIQSIRRIKKLD